MKPSDYCHKFLAPSTIKKIWISLSLTKCRILFLYIKLQCLFSNYLSLLVSLCEKKWMIVPSIFTLNYCHGCSEKIIKIVVNPIKFIENDKLCLSIIHVLKNDGYFMVWLIQTLLNSKWLILHVSFWFMGEKYQKYHEAHWKEINSNKATLFY